MPRSTARQRRTSGKCSVRSTDHARAGRRGRAMNDDASGKGTQRLWRPFKQGKLTPEAYQAQGLARFAPWKAGHRLSQEHARRVTPTKRPSTWVIAGDHETYLLLIDALRRAIAAEVAAGHGQGEEAKQFRARCIALSRADYPEGGECSALAYEPPRNAPETAGEPSHPVTARGDVSRSAGARLAAKQRLPCAPPALWRSPARTRCTGTITIHPILGQMTPESTNADFVAT